MNFQEILDEIKKQGISDDNFADGEMENPLPNIGEWKQVDIYGGEGQGDDYWAVNYFPEHDIYIKISGYYASYDGTTFYNDCYSQVTPKEETVIVYHSIQ